MHELTVQIVVLISNTRWGVGGILAARCMVCAELFYLPNKGLGCANKRLYLAFFVRLAFNTMSLSGGSPLYETRFLHGNDEPLHILSAAFYPPYELC